VPVAPPIPSRVRRTTRTRRLTVAAGGTALVLGAIVGCTTSDADGDERQRSRATPSAPTAPTPRETEPPSLTREPTVEPDPSRAEQAELDHRLIAAAWDDDVDRARSLIARGADVNAKDDTEQSAYLVATSEGYLDLLELTLGNGAQVNSKDSFNGTGLIRAAERGHWDIAGRLVQAGVSIDHVNNLGWTALHEAVILGDGGTTALDTVRVLVAAGADVTVPAARDGQTAYEHAKSLGYDAIADLLGRAERVQPGKGGDATDAGLLRAASVDDADAAALALRAGADLEARNERQQTPLLVASARDSVEVARILVALGADPDALDYRHDTPWLVTGVTGSVAMLETLLPAHPDLTVRNRYGGVSVIPASERGHVAYVRRVVQTDIDVNHVNDLGWTALLEAVILGDGSTPYQQIVGTLLDAGADPSIADGDGVTALEHAQRTGQTTVAGIIRRAD
jgi:uncharacterized protein